MGKGFAKKVIVKTATFCWKHKFLVGLGASMLGAYCYGRHVQSDIYRKQEDAIQKERERQDKMDEYSRKRQEYLANPENHLGPCGVIEDDWWDEGIDEDPVGNLIISGANLKEMGELGEEIALRVAHGKCGSMDPDILKNLVSGNHSVDLVLSISKAEETGEPNTNKPEYYNVRHTLTIENVPADMAHTVSSELKEECDKIVKDIVDRHRTNIDDVDCVSIELTGRKSDICEEAAV